MGLLRTVPLGRWAVVSLPLLIAVVAACATGSGEEADPPEAAGSSSTTAAPAVSETVISTTAPEATTTSTAPVETIRYDGDFSVSVAPIFAEKCASCHSPGGPGSPHWSLVSAADLADNHDGLADAVRTGFMPPWPAGGASPAFVGDRSLRDDQLQAILDWSADGAPLDVEPATPIEPRHGVVGLRDPDLVLTPTRPYAGSGAVDDYRCQIYDPDLPDGGWVTAHDFRPDETEVVHHAIGYLIPADRRALAEQRDGEDGRPGWSCFGSSGLGADDIVLGWAPGQDPAILPEGSGLWVEPGGFIVIQVHYHYEGPAPEDASALAVRLAAGPDPGKPGALDRIEVAQFVGPAEIPCAADEQGPLCDRDAALADAVARFGQEGVLADGILRICRASVDDFAGMTDGIASSSCDIPAGLAGAVGQIVSVLGHEHEIGSWFRMTVNPGRPEEQVLLDIPDWRFDWQYQYEPVVPIVLDGDDIVRIECGWDRARRDPDLEPAYVLWADGTNDEMCFATITVRPVAGG